MDWLENLFCEPSSLQTVLIISIICAIGLALGEIKVKGVGIGSAFVFFAGIIIGDVAHRLGVEVDRSMLSFAQNFGLILFVYALGVQVGPGFFPSFKQGGLKLNLFALMVLLLTTLCALGIYAAIPSVSFSDSIGLLCGAVTNTPMLGAAQQSLLEVHPEQLPAASSMATACAVGYPCGVLGVLACLIIMKYFSGKRGDRAGREHTDDSYVAEFHVSNPAIIGTSIANLGQFTDRRIIITRLWRDGKVLIPNSHTVLEKDDHILAVLSRTNLTVFKGVFGETDDKDWNRPDIDWNNIDGSNLVSRHVLVTRKELNGVKMGSLHLRNSFDINVTRINRAGITLVAYPGLRLQLGDRLTIVGTETAIKKVGEILGNEEKVLNVPNLLSIFIGMLLGVLLGSIPLALPGMSTPVKLGVAGGPIVVGIIIGAFGPRFHMSTYATRSANLMLRQLGIVIYLACLGFGAGADFVSVVFSSRGLMWIGLSLFIAIVPVLVTAFVARRFGGLDFAQNAGMICAAMANPMALTYANTDSDEDEASEAYATAYPLSMFIRVLSVQILMILLI